MGNCEEEKNPFLHSIDLIVFINALKTWALFTHVTYFDRYLWLLYQTEKQHFSVFFSLGSEVKLENVLVVCFLFLFFSFTP